MGTTGVFGFRGIGLPGWPLSSVARSQANAFEKGQFRELLHVRVSALGPQAFYTHMNSSLHTIHPSNTEEESGSFRATSDPLPRHALAGDPLPCLASRSGDHCHSVPESLVVRKRAEVAGGLQQVRRPEGLHNSVEDGDADHLRARYGDGRRHACDRAARQWTRGAGCGFDPRALCEARSRGYLRA